MRKAVLPGSFDPPTNGHLNLITRAASIFDELHIVIAFNRGKKYLFDEKERQTLMASLLKDLPNVQVRLWDRLVVDYARREEISVMIRGVRALADFSYEFELAMTNKELYPELEIIFMPTDPKYFVLRSSAIKEIAMFGGDISSMVPPEVGRLLVERLRGA
jgi:pantetheine-phosphate adenylyltransferase